MKSAPKIQKKKMSKILKAGQKRLKLIKQELAEVSQELMTRQILSSIAKELAPTQSSRGGSRRNSSASRLNRQSSPNLPSVRLKNSVMTDTRKGKVKLSTNSAPSSPILKSFRQ